MGGRADAISKLHWQRVKLLHTKCASEGQLFAFARRLKRALLKVLD